MEDIIGREKECGMISGLIGQRKNIIIFGEEGIGKTTIINKVLSNLVGLNIFFSAQSKTLKETLLNFMPYASCDKKTIQSLNILDLKKLFYSALDKNKPQYIIFDHVERVRPKFHSFFVYLLERELPLIVLCRGLEKKDIGNLCMSLFNFERVEISNFDKPSADLLIDHFIKEFGIKITKEKDFKKQIFYFSKGNPKIIKQLCFLARDVKYKKNETIDVKIMDLDRRINEVVH